MGTPKCLELADLAIKECPQSIDLFHSISFTFEANITGYKIAFTVKKLNNLLPYLSFFKSSEVSHLASGCERNGFQSWARHHLYELLSDKDKKFYFPTDNDLVAELLEKSKEKHALGYVEGYWIERFDKRNDPKSRIFRIIEMLLKLEPTLDTFRIAALCIKVKGSRSDIDILKNYTYFDDEEEISKIIRDTEYFLCRKTLN
jgi:hypothetical protein